MRHAIFRKGRASYERPRVGEKPTARPSTYEREHQLHRYMKIRGSDQVKQQMKGMCPVCNSWVYFQSDQVPGRCRAHPTDELINLATASTATLAASVPPASQTMPPASQTMPTTLTVRDRLKLRLSSPGVKLGLGAFAYSQGAALALSIFFYIIQRMGCNEHRSPEHALSDAAGLFYPFLAVFFFIFSLFTYFLVSMTRTQAGRRIEDFFEKFIEPVLLWVFNGLVLFGLIVLIRHC